MKNPYAPSTVNHAGPQEWSSKQFHTFAGCWLIVCGFLHFVVINVLSKPTSFASVEWTPLFLSGLGLLVAIQIRVAIAFTRLIGSFTILGLGLASVLFLVGVGGRRGSTYGNAAATEPHLWQLLLLLASIAATMLPPWWMLQRAVAGNNRVDRSRRANRL